MKQNFLLIFLFSVTISYAQVSIGNKEPNPNSVLDLSNKKGKVLILPKLSQSELDSLKKNKVQIDGALYYNSTSKAIETQSNGKSTPLISAPNNTSVVSGVKNETLSSQTNQNLQLIKPRQMSLSLTYGYTGRGSLYKLSFDDVVKSPHGWRADLFFYTSELEAQVDQKYIQWGIGGAYQLNPNFDLGGWDLKAYVGVFMGGREFRQNTLFNSPNLPEGYVFGNYFGVSMGYEIFRQTQLFGTYTSFYSYNVDYAQSTPAFGLGISYNFKPIKPLR